MKNVVAGFLAASIALLFIYLAAILVVKAVQDAGGICG